VNTARLAVPHQFGGFAPGMIVVDTRTAIRMLLPRGCGARFGDLFACDFSECNEVRKSFPRLREATPGDICVLVTLGSAGPGRQVDCYLGLRQIQPRAL
jgi:hypothetical protein